MTRATLSLADAQMAANDWGFNCGPAAICAVTGLSPAQLRPHMGTFEAKGYTNPTLMFDVLRRLNVRWQIAPLSDWPRFGLARIQWHGPWTAAGVPMRARYRHTHWVAAQTVGDDVRIFDVNAMCVGGWIPEAEWSGQLVPWLLGECEPRANGKWSRTHVLEVEELLQ